MAIDRGASYTSQRSDVSTEVRQRFSSVSYITSVAGILKILIVVLFLVSGILFLSISKCPQTESWYEWLYPLATLSSALLSLALYAIFLFAIAKTNLNLWAAVDVICSLLAAVFVTVVCVLTILQCNSGETIHLVPAPMGLVGAVLLAANAAATYIMWKYESIPAPTYDEQRRGLPPRDLRRFTLEA